MCTVLLPPGVNPIAVKYIIIIIIIISVSPVANIKISHFWPVTPCSLAEGMFSHISMQIRQFL
jgi:hypothetical protein